jgi:protein-tyrosine kinase
VSKIYEALEWSQKTFERAPAPSPLIMPPAKFQVPEPERKEEMVRLYRTVESLLADTDHRVIQFIGSRRAEGTSTVVKEFAVAAVLRFGKSALLLDTDRSSLIQHFLCRVHPEYCLEEAIRNGAPIDSAFAQVENSKLFVCAVTRNSGPSSQLMDHYLYNGLMKTLRERFDFVLIDSPPLEVSSDGLAMVRKADGVVLVVEAEKTRWPAVQNLKDSVLQHGGNILGVVLNKRRYYVPEWIYKRL